MIVFPNAKINLGLNIVGKRTDGYHDLETVFYPIPLCDALEIKKMDEKFPSDTDCDLKVTGCAMDCNESQNLVVKAYQLIARDFKLPRIHAHLFKRIPMQAGLGGGSSDAAFMIKLLDERFRLNMGQSLMEDYAAQLGADCAFFIRNKATMAGGIGNIFSPINLDLSGWHFLLVKPDEFVSTREAYSQVCPAQPVHPLMDTIQQPIEKWKDLLFNDFEQSVLPQHTVISDIKHTMYNIGATYASMSGSGSSVFGLFKEEPKDAKELFHPHFTFYAKL